MMEKTIETILGDTEGVAYSFPVYRFRGTREAAPSAYIQAALHAGELPGTVAIDALMPRLRQAEAEGRLRGSITVVPAANPSAARNSISEGFKAASILEPAPISTGIFRCSTGPIRLWPRNLAAPSTSG